MLGIPTPVLVKLYRRTDYRTGSELASKHEYKRISCSTGSIGGARAVGTWAGPGSTLSLRENLLTYLLLPYNVGGGAQSAGSNSQFVTPAQLNSHLAKD